VTLVFCVAIVSVAWCTSTSWRRDQFSAPYTPLKRAVFDEAIDLYRRSRQAGVTVRSSVDCLIAACALRHGLTVVHRDRDFNDLARISPLEAHDILRH
jgi:predicted nucleic acid-binding protein